MAMQGVIDFNQSLPERIKLLKDLPISTLLQVRESITFTPGAREVCRALKRLGYKLAVISGGFMPFANYVKAELGLDYAFANNIEEDSASQTLTGNLSGPIVNGARKAYLLEVIAQAEQIPLDQVYKQTDSHACSF
jgi:phosphoserine phosphatase SerB